MFENLVMTLVGNNVTKIVEGREYQVAPTVMLVEGVHESKNGPILWLNEEFSINPTNWDHKPVVVYHPELAGKQVLATNIEVLNAQKVGFLLETTADPKLRTNTFIDIGRAKMVDERVLIALNQMRKMEVSTGMIIDLEEKEGSWKGQKYRGIARNIRPDHLALLPDRVGACSIAKGAGLFQTNEASFIDSITNSLGDHEKSSQIVKNIFNGIVTIANEMSFGSIANEVRGALSTALGKPGQYWDGFIEELFLDYVVFYDAGKMYRVSYTVSSTGVVALKEKPAEVKRVTSYEVRNEEPVGKVPDLITNNEDHMTKAELVTKLITNSKGDWTETERTSLEAKTEKALSKMVESYNETPAPVVPPVVTPPVAPAVTVPVLNADLKAMLEQHYPGFDSMYKVGVQTQNAQKAAAIEKIIASPNNKFTEEFLKAQQSQFLEGLAALATPIHIQNEDQDIFNGFQGAMLMGGQMGAPIHNQASIGKIEMPLVRSMDYSKPYAE